MLYEFPMFSQETILPLVAALLVGVLLGGLLALLIFKL